MTNFLLSILLKSLSHFKYALHLNQGLLIKNLIAKCNIQKNKEKAIKHHATKHLSPVFTVLLLSGTYAMFEIKRSSQLRTLLKRVVEKNSGP